ncbi:hypothetical protein BO71DRAFT_483711 [Aspergillus ellipticus CBS 707.79]|uniref:N-acetyltransferase domain-containing protein n=1 Tax=Aspergillus ellipticus CBS 707.79 TaxID=1448320 RepID=A0A319DBM1_9EURO|nr:hypothetical protein BO71DRAFT_483711 [Aspergillus ellipticus CBS 707.79]
MSPSTFEVRDARTTESDIRFIISTFDSSLSYLNSIGSLDQWGLIPFSERGDFAAGTRTEVEQSEENRLTGGSKENGLRMFIVEREYLEENTEEKPPYLRIASDGRRLLPVGFAYVRENWVPVYVKSQTHFPVPDTEGEGFLYLEVIVTDCRVGELRRGAGAALLSGIREYGRERGTKVFWVDSWAGNERRLVRYYEEQGFNVVGDWSHERANRTPWLGTLMRMEI